MGCGPADTRGGGFRVSSRAFRRPRQAGVLREPRRSREERLDGGAEDASETCLVLWRRLTLPSFPPRNGRLFDPEEVSYALLRNPTGRADRPDLVGHESFHAQKVVK